MEEWNGGMEEWRNGEWRNGEMEEWRNGGMEEWRNGGREGSREEKGIGQNEEMRLRKLKGKGKRIFSRILSKQQRRVERRGEVE